MNKHTGVKIVISIFLLYHLAAVSILPNSSSMIGRKLAWLFLPYANPLLFNRTWQFFSPGPMSAFYLEYNTLTNAAPGVDEERPPYEYPPKRKDNSPDDYYLRTYAGMRLIAMNPTTFEADFIPYLCRVHPEASALDLRSVTEELKPIEQSTGTESFKELSERNALPRKVYECPGRSGESTDAQ